MKRIVLFNLISLVTLAVNAQGKGAEFKGVAMGSPLNQLKEVEGLAELRCTITGEQEESCFASRPSITYGGQHVQSLMADFRNGKLASVGVQTFGGTGAILQQTIKAKYGRPTAVRKVRQSLKNGNHYQMSVIEWRLPNGDYISIQDHPAPVDEVFTEINSKQFMELRNKAAKATPKQKSDI